MIKRIHHLLLILLLLAASGDWVHLGEIHRICSHGEWAHSDEPLIDVASDSGLGGAHEAEHQDGHLHCAQFWRQVTYHNHIFDLGIPAGETRRTVFSFVRNPDKQIAAYRIAPKASPPA